MTAIPSLLFLALLPLTLSTVAPTYDPDLPLNLTDLLESQTPVEDIQRAAMVQLDPATISEEEAVESYSGYFHIDESSGPGESFFWYFPSQDGNTSAPLLIWLQGGPGGSSLFGLFAENGPYVVNSDLKTLSRRKETWGERYALLYIDNPFGAGYSHTKDGYVRNETQVGENLLSLLDQFYRVFPEKKASDLYVTGESYAGHYVPALAFAIMEAPESGINLKGIAIGDGWVDPINMIPEYPGMMFNLGLADGVELAKIQDYCDKTVAFIKAGQMADAFKVWDEMINGDIFPYPNYFKNITGLGDYYNYLRQDSPPEQDYFADFVQRPEVRRAIHAGAETSFGGDATTCEMNLVEDFHRSMAPRVVALLEKGVKVMIYVGQLDIIIGAPLVEAFVPKLEWGGQKEYQTASRSLWYVGSRVAGYVRQARNLIQVTVRAAGHILPFDQPEAAKDMITRFVEGLPFNKE